MSFSIFLPYWCSFYKMVTFVTFQGLVIFHIFGFIWAVLFLTEQNKCGCYTVVFNIIWMSVLKTGLSVCLWNAHAQFSNTCRTKTHFRVPLWRNDSSTEWYEYKWALSTCLTKWMKGICFCVPFNSKFYELVSYCLHDRLLLAVQWISPDHLCQDLGVICLWFFRCCFRVCFTEISPRFAVNIITVGISRVNALICLVCFDYDN